MLVTLHHAPTTMILRYDRSRVEQDDVDLETVSGTVSCG